MTQTLNGTAGADTITGTNPGDAANPDGIDIINGGGVTTRSAGWVGTTSSRAAWAPTS